MRHRGDCRWGGVRDEGYKRDPASGGWPDVIRRTLSRPQSDATAFELRYFELAPGGRTSRERHEHEHVVVCLRGRGRATVRGRAYELRYLDTLYIPPGAAHCLQNPSQDEPFGFFCIVDSERDRPVAVD